jgi:hypothetical protein
LNSDTPAYIRYADVAVAKFTKHQPEWWYPQGSNQSGLTLPHSESASDAKVPFLGRSIYYGMLLKLGDALDKMWPSIVVQAAAVVLAVALTLVNATSLSLVPLSILVIGLSFVTPVGFHVSTLMPDVFAGLTILATANLIVFGERMSRGCLLTWVGLLSAGLLFHSTHVLIALTVFAVCLVVCLFWRGAISRVGLVAVFLCILVGFAGDAVFSIATERAFGVAPIRPPFLTARVIADGPGEAYLTASCPGSGFTVCRFTDRFPIDDPDTFLWSTDPAKGGVFTPTDAATRRALSAEQFRLVGAVFRYDPFGEVAAMARNTLRQIGKVSMANFNLDSQDRSEFRQSLPARYLAAAEATRSWDATLPVASMSVIVLVVLLGSAAYLVRAMVIRGNRSVDGNGPERLAVLIIIGVIANSFICGTMSVPSDRFQSRVVWLIPLTAALIYWRNSRYEGSPGER